MSTIAYELAHAACRATALNERLPELQRLDLAAEWRALEDELDQARSEIEREIAVNEWRGRVETRVAQRLAQAPLEHA